jgi:phosphopantetheinyl transferase (holo-ACP synthase)
VSNDPAVRCFLLVRSRPLATAQAQHPPAHVRDSRRVSEELRPDILVADQVQILAHQAGTAAIGGGVFKGAALLHKDLAYRGDKGNDLRGCSICFQRLPQAPAPGPPSLVGEFAPPSDRSHVTGMRVESVEARWAKAAVRKALGTRFGPIGWLDIEVAQDEAGCPRLHLLHGWAASLAEARGPTRWAFSMSHDGGTAIAFVVAM